MRISIKIKKFNIIITIIIALIIIVISCSKENNESGLVYGVNDAPIKIINYTSFQCSACKDLHNKLHEVLKKYIENGSVKFVEKPIDIKRFKYDEIIYEHMDDSEKLDFDKLLDIYNSQDKLNTIESEEEIIELLNLDEEINLENRDNLKKIMNEKEKIALKEVPTMFINGEKISNDITVEEFENKIQKIIEAN